METPDLSAFLERAAVMASCVCEMVEPVRSIPSIAAVLGNLATNVQQQTAVLVTFAEGLGIRSNVPVGAPGAWNAQDLEDAILLIDQPCAGEAERVQRLQEAFRLARAADPSTPSERQSALRLGDLLGATIEKYPVPADKASRPVPYGGC